MKSGETGQRPLLIYDGECRFCCKWIERWKSITGDRVDYAPSQAVAGKFPEIAAEDFAGSVIFVDADGTRSREAEAVFRSLATGSVAGRLALMAFRRVPGFAPVTNGFYRFVARNRGLFSVLTTLGWGTDVRPPTYAVGTFLFLRVLGLIYGIAFASYLVQVPGLSGSGGIMPVELIFPQTLEAAGTRAYWQLPSLVWLSPTEAMLTGLSVAGLVFSALLIAGIAQPIVLAALWAAYLSLVVAGGVFYSFQWDGLLLEVGLLAILVAPWRLGPRGILQNPHPAARLLLWWLLFRLMFSSGVVKLSSGDPTWANLTALDFHYWTQPLPNAVSWFMNLLPDWAQRTSVVGMFGVELLLPFLIWLPRRFRLVAAAGFVALQIVVELTGNYGFFNVLTAALCLLLIDDSSWRKLGMIGRRGGRTELGEGGRRWFPSAIMWPVALAIFLLSLVPFSGAFRQPLPVLEPLAGVYEHVAPFRSINGYGLFAVMTTERNEITFEGSDDGLNWKTYEFRYKPGDLQSRPPFVAPYMPRLDWQMWFAALGGVEQSPWMFWFVSALLKAEPQTLALLKTDPFDGRSPRYLRALLDSYTFTTWEERQTTGAWWKSEAKGFYIREISADQLR